MSFQMHLNKTMVVVAVSKQGIWGCQTFGLSQPEAKDN
jgi:hypothetical protein